MDKTYSIGSLAEALASGRMTRVQAERELDRIEKESSARFVPTNFTPKDKPWDQEYLDDLVTQVALGKASKEYLLHIAEVSEEVYRPKRVKRVFAIAAGIAAALAVVAVICWAVGKR